MTDFTSLPKHIVYTEILDISAELLIILVGTSVKIELKSLNAYVKNLLKK